MVVNPAIFSSLSPLAVPLLLKPRGHWHPPTRTVRHVPCGKPSAPAFEGGLCGETCADLAHCLSRGTRFYDLRHFYASTLIAANLNPKVIQARLGHATITSTMDTYGISSPTRKTSAARPSMRSSR